MNESLQSIKGVGAKREKSLHKLGIYNIPQLLGYFPRGYEDRNSIYTPRTITPGTCGSVFGTIVHLQERRPRPRMSLLEIVVGDDTGGRISAVFFNQGYKKNFYKVGQSIYLYGKAEISYNKLQMNSPDIEIMRDGQTPELGILPVYALVEGVTQNMIRQTIKECLQANTTLEEVIPSEVRAEHHLMNRYEATKELHYPTSMDRRLEARRTMAFEELYIMQTGLLLVRAKNKAHMSNLQMKVNGPWIKTFVEELPFQLTGDQKKVFQQICKDMEQPGQRMQRLVQGDVGSGKTVVAAMALLKAIENGYQGAFMAPTEILATQHYHNLCEIYAKLPIQVALLTGSTKEKERISIDEGLRAGTIHVVVGTHALIQKNVVFHNLALTVIDEQHRFGVRQRAALQEKGASPHLLIMTATPIPRTMTLSIYGDLDVSSIKEMPPGRKPVKTYGVDSSYKKRLWDFFAKEVAAGHRVYVVCPLVEESETLDLQAAERLYEEMSVHFFGKIAVGLLHGRMTGREKEQIMEEFQKGALQLLVSTTVIEVGVDVPEATIMCVMGAERFGLSQLHQLRGRVGRGNAQSYCILVSDTKGTEGRKRIQLMEQSTDGFYLAEQDLLMRGSGQLFGYMQHGLPDLKVADIVKDIELLQIARQAAVNRLAKIGLAAMELEMHDTLHKYFGPEFLLVLNS